MLKLYYNPLSTNARRVWIALLEKQLQFELISLKLNGDQFQPDFLAISPFHHVPVLADGDFQVIETLAILDDIETKYPAPALLPEDLKERAIVRMVQMVTVNELVPAMSPLVRQTFGGEADPKDLEKSHQQVGTVLTFFEGLLGEKTFFVSSFTFADIVAGVSAIWLPELGISLDKYPNLKAWSLAILGKKLKPVLNWWQLLRRK